LVVTSSAGSQVAEEVFSNREGGNKDITPTRRAVSHPVKEKKRKKIKRKRT